LKKYLSIEGLSRSIQKSRCEITTGRDNELFLIEKFVFCSIEPKAEELRDELWAGSFLV